MRAGELESWRQGMRATVTTDQMRDVGQAMVVAAIAGDVSAAALLCRFVYEPPKGSQPSGLTVDETALETLEGCRAVLQQILKWQLAGMLEHEQAHGLRQTVMAAIDTIKAEQGDKLMDALSEAGHIPFFAEAGREVESFSEYMEGQDAD